MSGFSSPNYTQAPNDLFDTLMRDMSEAELKVVMAAVRQTFGYHKQRDAISMTRFEELTGLSRQSVANGIDAAIKRGVLRVVGEGKRGVRIFELVVISDQSTNETSTIQDFSTDEATTIPKSRHTKEKSLKEKTQKTIPAPSGAGASPDWISEFFQALAAFAQAELERDPAFEAICRELFGIEHTAIQDKSTRGRINGLASTARNNFQTVYEQHFTDGWTRDLEEKLARAISAFVKSWKATRADTAVPLARDKFGTAFLKFLQTYKPDRKPAPAAAPPPLIQPLTLEERTALAEARKTFRPTWEQTGEPTS